MDTPVLRHLPRPCPGTRTTAPASTPYLKMTSISYFLLLPSSSENSAEFHFYVKVQQLTPKPQANRIVDCFSQTYFTCCVASLFRMSANCVTPQQSHPPKTNNNRRVVTGKAVSRHRGLAGVKVCYPARLYNWLILLILWQVNDAFLLLLFVL